MRVFNSPKGEVVPLLVTINQPDADVSPEITELRQLLDTDLATKNRSTCETVASTIFPVSMWNQNLPREQLFDRYKRALPQIRKCPQNHNGTYFERMIQHGNSGLNQLDFLIKSRAERGNNRRSVLQLAIVDPVRDLTHQRVRGFPCLQQVSFAKFRKDELAVNGFYGTQYIFEKAYGNYLGLHNLGRFVARELGLRLTQINCFVGIASLGTTKRSVENIAKNLSEIVVKFRKESV